MSDYTCDMLCKDHDEMRPILGLLKDVQFHEDEWPQVNIEAVASELGYPMKLARRLTKGLAKRGLIKPTKPGGLNICRVNPNLTTADTVGFFKRKYGKTKGMDYAVRFLNIIWFITDNRNALIKEGLIRDDQGGVKVREELLQVMLASFCRPKPPAILPSTPLGGKRDMFSLAKVLKVVKPLLKDSGDN